MVDGMAQVSKRLLLRYKEINGCFPSVSYMPGSSTISALVGCLVVLEPPYKPHIPFKVVVVMRDGIADNQVQEMIDIEINGIRQVSEGGNMGKKVSDT